MNIKGIPEELDEMIQEYLSNGSFSEKGRMQILKKAQKLQVDTDKIKLYITTQEQKQKLEDVAAEQEKLSPEREERERKEREVAERKKLPSICPYCGNSVLPYDNECPTCSKHLTSGTINEYKRTIDNLEEALLELQSSTDDFEINKANVERYARKARIDYGSNPNVIQLIREVNAEIEKAEKKYKAQHTWIKEHPYLTSFFTLLIVVILLVIIIDDPIAVIPAFFLVFIGSVIIVAVRDDKKEK